ncbi:MAG: tetratricopeptide repeat-containing sensor histidine kinase [bacterium]
MENIKVTKNKFLQILKLFLKLVTSVITYYWKNIYVWDNNKNGKRNINEQLSYEQINKKMINNTHKKRNPSACKGKHTCHLTIDVKQNIFRFNFGIKRKFIKQNLITTMFFFFILFQGIFASEINTIPDSLLAGLNNHGLKEKIEAYSKVMNYYNRVLPEQSIGYGEKALQITRKNGYKLGEAEILYLLGVSYHAQSKYTKAMEYYRLSYDIMKEQKNNVGIGKCLNRIALIYNVLGNFDKAFEYCLKSVSILERENDKKSLGESYNHLGILYYILNDIPKAKEASFKALKFCETMNEDLVLAVSHEHLVVIYIKTKEYDKALYHVQKSLELRKAKNDRIGIAGSYENMAIIYKNTKKYNDAIKYYNKSLALKKELNNQRGMSSSISGIGMIYFNLGQYEKSLGYILQAYQIRKKLGDKRGTASSLNQIAETYLAMGNYKSALTYYKLAKTINDSLLSEQKNKVIAEFQEKFQQVKREEKIRSLQKENIIQKNQRNSLLIISFLLLTTVIFIFIAYHSKRKVNNLLINHNAEVTGQKEELQYLNDQLKELIATKDKFFSIIAHDLKSLFLGFLGMTEMMANETSSFTHQELSATSKEMHKSANNLYKLLENLLAWAQIQKGTISFIPKEFDLLNLVKHNIEMINQRAAQKGINLVSKISDIQLVYADVKMIDTVLRNLLSNAVKFTNQGGKIVITSKEINNQFIEISIADSGIGISEELCSKLFKIEEKVGREGTDGETSTGLGLLLCKEFVEKNGGKIWVKSDENVGSTFYFTIPELKY